MASEATADLTLFLPVSGVVRPEDLGLMFDDLVTEGVVGATDLVVSERAAGANLSVDVAAGSCYVAQDSSSPKPGPIYRVRFASVSNLTVSAPHATLTRIDRVVVEVLDTTFAGVSNTGRVRIIEGTPAGSPSAPAEPSNAITIATVSVAGAVSSIVNANITDARARAGVGGNIVTPTAIALRVAAQSINSGSATDISWDTEATDTDRMISVPTTAFTIRTPGVYIITVQTFWTGNATGTRTTELRISGTTAKQAVELHDGGTAITRDLTAIRALAAGATVGVRLTQTSGGALNLSGAALELTRIGA